MTNDLVVVTAIRAASSPLFCETTRATVAVSDPERTPTYVEGSRTAALLTAPNGTIAGLLDPAWPGARVSTTAPSKDRYQADVVHEDGLFAYLSVIGPDNAAATTIRPSGDDVERALPKAGAPLVDAPAPADRSSARGRFLDSCIDQARAYRVVVDAASLVAGRDRGGPTGLQGGHGGQRRRCRRLLPPGATHRLHRPGHAERHRRHRGQNPSGRPRVWTADR
ncbi:hypothetical protein V5P93_004492 [Actinokineospora auranticolor]|uniref:Uncharacterized protein n=1 Tax=Actinokineospora auranticolor TaxID=155976 RepID=A0A2S6GTF1_9PSEU|nr:hypothetical protein [Actinokineospora auranticolor]PPK68401.1 hypothetical protein CLV40_105124 [Actinokineospora auranticolor]